MITTYTFKIETVRLVYNSRVGVSRLFPIKGHMVNISGFVVPILSATTIQPFNMKSVPDHT